MVSRPFQTFTVIIQGTIVIACFKKYSSHRNSCPINNPSEANIAKRRGHATMISHNIPPLGKLAGYLKGVKGKSIRVEGYTETLLSASWSLQQFPSGWELAAARAVTVTRLLQDGGVTPLALSAVSYGEYRPLSDNISELGRARNRRIQLVLIPKPDNPEPNRTRINADERGSK